LDSKQYGPAKRLGSPPDGPVSPVKTGRAHLSFTAALSYCVTTHLQVAGGLS
jgi:hypothetical protein